MVEKPRAQTKEQIEGELNMAATVRSNALGLKLLLIGMELMPDDNPGLIQALIQALGAAIGNSVKPEMLVDLLVDVKAEVERCTRSTLTIRVNLEAAGHKL